MTMLTPIMVRTFGRTGSTMLMQILGSQPRVCFERAYSFEHRYLSYAYNLARVASAQPANGDDWNNEVLNRGDSSRIGPLPYKSVEAMDRPRLFDTLFRSVWQGLSTEMRASARIGADVPAFYAEKTPYAVAEAATTALGGRNLFLLRDPRDEMVSTRSFNAKRGYCAFDWRPDDSDASYARRLCESRRGFLQHLRTLQTDEQTIAVRYEDLALETEATVRRLGDWLGAPLDPRAARADKRILKRHSTSRDAAASVERWRSELSGEVQAIFATEIGTELAGVGYAV